MKHRNEKGSEHKLFQSLPMSSSRRTPSSAVLLVGAAVGVLVTVYMIMSYYSSNRHNKNDGVEDYRKDNPDGFDPGDASMDDLLPPKQDKNATRGGDAKRDSDKSGSQAQKDAKTLSLADIIISDATEETMQELMPDPLSALPPPSPSPLSLPRIVTKRYSIDGVSTDMFVQVFADRILVGVSQLHGKFGNYLMCEAIPDEVNPKHVEYNVTPLLGAREDTLLTVYARQITERIEKLQPNPILLTVIVAISLNKNKAPQPEVFNAIVDLLEKLYRQASGA